MTVDRDDSASGTRVEAQATSRAVSGPLPVATAAYDFPIPTNPTALYVVAATPRSGSTYLCRQLWSTGLLGAPMEYFNYSGAMLQMVARLRPNTLSEYVQRLFALRTSPTSVFGFKAHWEHFQVVLKGGAMPLFANLQFIHIQRRDRLAQAVSHAKASQTGQWATTDVANRAPAYDPRLIRRCLERIERENNQWRALFRRLRRTPMDVAYEPLVENPGAVADEILRQFGVVPDPARHIDIPMTERQSDSVSREWIERFRREGHDTG